MNEATRKLDTLSKISKQRADMKAALKKILMQERTQQRADRRRLAMNIGQAQLADVEAAEGEERSRRKADISEVLAKHVTSNVEIGFLKAKKWL